jgi:hypothetical protein
VIFVARGFGSSASGRACHCKVKDRANWEIVGYAGKKKVVYCNKCYAQWDTAAKYAEELKKASYLK